MKERAYELIEEEFGSLLVEIRLESVTFEF